MTAHIMMVLLFDRALARRGSRAVDARAVAERAVCCACAMRDNFIARIRRSARATVARATSTRGVLCVVHTVWKN
jgi:hypothetical protein